MFDLDVFGRVRRSGSDHIDGVKRYKAMTYLKPDYRMLHSCKYTVANGPLGGG